jgi:serine/threonine-protein kinase
MTTSERFLEIQELFHAALKLPPAERQAFLITRCPQDESLKDEVEALLVEDADVSGPLRDLSEESRFTIAIGTRLGAYEVTGAIGAGGMGEVYRARDSKLNRDVALKILPESFAADPERIFRFRREAQLLASLNHPNIAAIYGLEESSHLLAIAMELVEGPTLAERMSAGAIPVEEALAIAKQMAEALEAAHDRGIIHRDLKPANVKITPDGVVKVLDFGLGKDLKTNNSVVNPLPTRKGLIMGTAPYMSPEQARGGAVDKRADIWAFGVVLYEMVSGSRLFAGETTSDTLAAVLAKEPDWNRAPLKVQRMLRRCLEKDPKRRLRDIADAWALLDEVPQALPAAKTRRWKLAGVVAVLFTFASWIVWRATRPIESALQPLVRLDVDLGSDVSLGSLRGADAIISPDGRRLVYVSQSRLFTRRLDQATSTELAGTQYAHAPFFSPDGQWVAFLAGSKL